MISILILTKNEAQDLPGCLESVAFSDDIHILDSFSTDETVEIAAKAGARVTQRAFDNWSAHQNWGLANIPFRHPWVLYIDADERVSPELREAALAAVRNVSDEAAFRVRRRDFFANGQWLRHAQISPFYIRLFRPGKIRYERLVNPLTLVDGPIGDIPGFLNHYPFSKGIRFWIERHLRYADLEAQTIRANRQRPDYAFSPVKAFCALNFHERRYHQKELFYRLPFRPLIKFFYMMVLRRAFLDGPPGVTYALLQSIYEYFIVLKSRELSSSVEAESSRELPAAPAAGTEEMAKWAAQRLANRHL